MTGTVAALVPSAPSLYTGESVAACEVQATGPVLAVQTRRMMDALHWVSAGAVSFARGLNDTPKMAALLLVLGVPDPRSDVLLVAVGIAVGGLLAAKRVARTLSQRITSLGHEQGLSANLPTAALVGAATAFGLPVSTTHVAVGSLFGIGMLNRTAHIRVIKGILLSWIVTLPCGALLGAIVFRLSALAALH